MIYIQDPELGEVPIFEDGDTPTEITEAISDVNDVLTDYADKE